MAEAIESDIGKIYAQNIAVVEKEFGGSASTNESSLLLKFFNQMEYLQKVYKEEEREMRKSQKGGRTFR